MIEPSSLPQSFSLRVPWVRVPASQRFYCASSCGLENGLNQFNQVEL